MEHIFTHWLHSRINASSGKLVVIVVFVSYKIDWRDLSVDGSNVVHIKGPVTLAGIPHGYRPWLHIW